MGFIETWAAFGCVKAFSKNILFSGNAIFRKGKCIQVFGCARNSFYGNEILVFVSGIRFTEWDLRKIIYSVCFRKIFSEKWNSFFYRTSFLNFFEFVQHYLNKPVTIHKYSSKFKHLHCLNTSVTVQKYSSTSTSKIILWIYPSSFK